MSGCTSAQSAMYIQPAKPYSARVRLVTRIILRVIAYASATILTWAVASVLGHDPGQPSFRLDTSTRGPGSDALAGNRNVTVPGTYVTCSNHSRVKVKESGPCQTIL